jgi:hypothetical protein
MAAMTLAAGCVHEVVVRPAWIEQPLAGVEDPDGVVFAAVGRSDLGRADPALARADAEADARSQVATQLRAYVRRVVARTSEAMRDHETGAVLGQTVVSDASLQVTEVVLVGSRPLETHYGPNPERPESVWVRLVVAVRPDELRSAIVDAGDREARRRGMQLRHEELVRHLEESLRAIPPQS